MKKYVFDTNTLIENPELLEKYDSSEEIIIIPLVVLEEIDNMKNGSDMLAFNARTLIRFLFDNKDKFNFVKSGVSQKSNDDEILAVTHLESAILVTRDKILMIKAYSKGVECELPRVVEDIKEKLYSGIKEIEVSRDFIDEFYSKGYSTIDEELFANQYVLFKGPNKQSAVGKYKKGRILKISNNNDDYQMYGIKPRNLEQLISLDALMDPDVPVVSLVGLAGSGKTMLALAGGLAQIKSTKNSPKYYKRVLVTRPIQTLGKDIGYLPGTLEEKMLPWLAPIYDNLEVLTENNTSMIEGLFEKEKVKIEAMTYIRGRSISDSYIIVDECQNISPHEIKTILTRVGENTKIVLTGDIEQIDNPKLNRFSNGLTYMIEKMKSYSITSHVSLTKGERSEVAALAANVL